VKRNHIVMSFVFALMLGLSIAGNVLAQIEPCEPAQSADEWLMQGQRAFADEEYIAAVDAFSCAIAADPQFVPAYREQVVAYLFAGQYYDALNTYTRLRAVVVPQQPDALDQIKDYYTSALESAPSDSALLTGYSFALWITGDPEQALVTLNSLTEVQPDSQYGLVFLGSASMFAGDFETGEAAFARALEADPDNAQLHFVLADGYLYGMGDVDRAFAFANSASALGLTVPRITAIQATYYLVNEDDQTAAEYFVLHIGDAASEIVETDPLEVGDTRTLEFLPGRAYRLPVELAAGDTLSITITSENDGVDSLLVVLDSDGNPVTANDDTDGFNAGLNWLAPRSDRYEILLTTFEAVGTGEIVLTRNP
jgi:tetratricopeptide (TPR) repeat protein